jgi:hypothetical protein
MDAMDLLAVIHGDGGHHTHDVGVEQSVVDAIRIVHETRGLVREVFDWHADPESSDYNDCDKDKCNWCERAAKVLGAPKNGPG